MPLTQKIRNNWDFYRYGCLNFDPTSKARSYSTFGWNYKNLINVREFTPSYSISEVFKIDTSVPGGKRAFDKLPPSEIPSKAGLAIWDVCVC